MTEQQNEVWANREPFVGRTILSKTQELEKFCNDTWGISAEETNTRNLISMYAEGYLDYVNTSGHTSFKRAKYIKHVLQDPEVYQHYLRLGEESTTIWPSNQE